jgi:hypothetical protein
MSRWTDAELRELIALWPTNSVVEIAERLHRPRCEIRNRARRLRLNGLQPHNPERYEDSGVNPQKRRPPQRRKTAPPSVTR